MPQFQGASYGVRTILEKTDIKDHALDAIGNTPLVRLQKLVPADCAQVLVKLEYTNPTGSYKDRMALAMIEEAEKRGDLKPGMTVVEYTGGSTGSSLAFVCAVKGYPPRKKLSPSSQPARRLYLAAAQVPMMLKALASGSFRPYWTSICIAKPVVLKKPKPGTWPAVWPVKKAYLPELPAP